MTKIEKKYTFHEFALPKEIFRLNDVLFIESYICQGGEKWTQTSVATVYQQRDKEWQREREGGRTREVDRKKQERERERKDKR